MPLNQLYIDLNNDEHIENDKQQNDKEIEKSLRNMMMDNFTYEEKLQFLNAIKEIPPYKDYDAVIEKLMKEI